jgi:hypothetical protein
MPPLNPPFRYPSERTRPKAGLIPVGIVVTASQALGLRCCVLTTYDCSDGTVGGKLSLTWPAISGVDRE